MALPSGYKLESSAPVILPGNQFFNNGSGKYVELKAPNSNSDISIILPEQSGNLILDYGMGGRIWDTLSPYPDNTVYFFGATYGDGKFIAVGTDYLLSSSDGGNTWVKTSAINQEWRDITYGDGRFVAVSKGVITGNAVMYSDDGENWVLADAPFVTEGILGPGRWNSVVYGDGKFVAGGSINGYIMYSVDKGEVWSLASGIPSEGLNEVTSIAYGDGKFVMLSQGLSTSAILYSTDGDNWTVSNTDEIGANIRGITYGGDKFIAFPSSTFSPIYYSYDGDTWVEGSYEETGSIGIVKCVYGDGLFLCVGNDSSIVYSTDGIAWRSAPAFFEPESFFSLVYGEGSFIRINRSKIYHSMSNKAKMGLGKLDNTSDKDKPISNATQIALNLKLDISGDGSQLSGLTKAQVGLGNVDNTSDLNKPISTAVQSALNEKLPNDGDLLDEEEDYSIRWWNRTLHNEDSDLVFSWDSGNSAPHGVTLDGFYGDGSQLNGVAKPSDLIPTYQVLSTNEIPLTGHGVYEINNLTGSGIISFTPSSGRVLGSVVAVQISNPSGYALSFSSGISWSDNDAPPEIFPDNGMIEFIVFGNSIRGAWLF